MAIDWADGDYSLTAVQLASVSEHVVGTLQVGPEHRLLDVACGTGNLAIAAARRGAQVIGVDPAAGLLAIAMQRARDEALPAAFVEGTADALPVGEREFDLAASVFGVIFAPDAGAAVGQMLRAVRPNGRLALTAWLREGPLTALGDILFGALPTNDGPANRWFDPEWVHELLTAQGAREIAITQHQISFTHTSPEASFAELEEHHPVWRWVRGQVADERWESVRRDSVAALHDGNEDSAAMRATSHYVLVRFSR